MQRKTMVAIGLVACVLAARPGHAGSINGTLVIGNSSANRAASSGRQPAKPRASAATEAVVYLEAIPEKVEKKLAKKARPAEMAQNHRTFIPKTLAIAAGTTVEFENQDRVYHNTFSVSPARRFDLGKYSPRERHAIRFDRAGVVQLFCDLHPKEFGYVCVTPNHAYARPDSTGAFQLPKLPAGNYTVKVWHPRYGKTTRDVVMPKKGDLSLTLKL